MSIILLLASADTHAQCLDKPFPTLAAYYQVNNGAGIEAGIWPVESSRFGGFFGAGFFVRQIAAPDKSEKNPTIFFTTYLKGQFRINRYVNLTASGGLIDLAKGFYQAGLRFTLPLSDQSLSAIIVEPQYGSRGFITHVGFGLKIGN